MSWTEQWERYDREDAEYVRTPGPTCWCCAREFSPYAVAHGAREGGTCRDCRQECRDGECTQGACGMVEV